jgi:hypothetical protein
VKGGFVARRTEAPPAGFLRTFFAGSRTPKQPLVARRIICHNTKRIPHLYQAPPLRLRERKVSVMIRRASSLLAAALLFVCFASPSPTLAREKRMMKFTPPADGRSERVYFSFASRDESKLVSLYHELVDLGARNVICFLPGTVVCELPGGVGPGDVSNDPDISVVFDSQVDEREPASGLFGPAWIKRCYARADAAQKKFAQETARPEFDPSAAWEAATFPVPDETVRKTQAALSMDYPDPRNIHQNSELMTGTILVNIILPESSPHPFHQEDWTDESIDAALGEASLGMIYYQNNFRKGGMSFLVRTIERVITSYEPINETFKEVAWIEDIMNRLGYEDDGSPDRHLTAVHEFNNDRRKEFKTQWVFTAFVVDAEKDPDHLFAGSRTVGWGYLGGPYFVTPYPAGSTATEQLFKYYMGSMFWALEESNTSMDGCTSYSGYLNVQNRNKTVRIDQYGGPVGCPGAGKPVPCIMNNVNAFEWFYSGEPCDYTAKMIGLSDLNHNSVPDCLDAPPTVYYENASVETVFTQGSPLRFKVVSDGVPNQNPLQDPDLRVDYAVPVKFVGRSENGVITQRLTPLDGVCDELEEDFEFNLDMLPGGSSYFSVVTRNSANAQSKDQIKEIYYIGLSYLHFGYVNQNEGNLIRFDLLGETFGANMKVHRVDIEGDQEDQVIAEGLEPYRTAGAFSLYQYLDRGVIPGVKYSYYIEGSFTTNYHGADTTVTTLTGEIETRSMIPVPAGSMVSEASPNPFRDRTMVSVVVPTTYDNPQAQFPTAVPTDTNVWVYDVLGRPVKRLYSARAAGQVLTLIWDGTNEKNDKVPAGVYFVKAFAGGAEGSTKLVLVR